MEKWNGMQATITKLVDKNHKRLHLDERTNTE